MATVVLPTTMCEQPARRRLRWIFDHELSQLRRRDAWSALLFSLVQIFFFYVPWYWWLRRQVRLCQEYVADAAAVAETGPVEGYAEFLLHWSAAPAVPAGASGGFRHPFDLFKRITLLIRSSLTLGQRLPQRSS